MKNNKENGKSIKNENMTDPSEKQVILDYREGQLKELLDGQVSFQVKNLIIGDVVFQRGETIDFCLERKTIADLASSIKDGRLQEQRKRILECVSPDRCFYLIEGAIPFVDKLHHLPITTIYGSLINKMVRDGIHIVGTSSLRDTTRFIKEFATRYLTGKLEYETKGNINYVQKPRKKGNFSVASCFASQLSCIPSISTVKITAIIDKFQNMTDFVKHLQDLEEPVEYLSNLTLPNGRKIGKSSSTKIVEYLGLKTGFEIGQPK